MTRSRAPNELDVPHWAIDVVQETRKQFKLPEAVTDRMIYAKLVEIHAWRPEDRDRKLEQGMLDLIKEAS